MYKIGFLGLGNMGYAILNGIVKKGLYQKEEIAFVAPSDKTKEKYLSFGINLLKDERELILNCKIIILAIKPQKYQEVFAKLTGIDFKDKTIVSLAPGKTIAYLQSVFPSTNIVRAMPNTPAKISKGTTTLAGNGNIKEVKEIFDSIGTSIVIDENLIDEVIPLNGSLPAYLFAFAKAFIDKGVEKGLSKEQARELVFSAILGSASLALNDKEDIDILISNVCSKGGSTIEGLNALKENNFFQAISKCFEACVERSKELAKV